MSSATPCMSRIFDDVHASSSRRKAHILDGPVGRSLFESPGVSVMMLETGMTKTATAATASTTTAAASGGGPASALAGLGFGLGLGLGLGDDGMSSQFRLLVDGIWLCCTACILTPVCWFVWDAMHADKVSVEMAGVPYKCSLFYMGLFVGLPGASVYVFCCTLVFNKRGKLGILLCMVSIFVFVCTIEQKCKNTPSVDTSSDFYMLATSVSAGIASQVAFVMLMAMSDERRQSLYVLMGFASVLVLLSVLAVGLAGTKFDNNFTKASCYITSLPLALALIVYILSTYSTLHPIRAVCKHV